MNCINISVIKFLNGLATYLIDYRNSQKLLQSNSATIID